MSEISQPFSSFNLGSAPVPHQPQTKPDPYYEDFSQLDQFFRMYGKYAFNLARQNLQDDTVAEEIVHEAFLNYWNGTYRSPQPLTSVTFFGWLLREVQSNCQKRLLEI